MKKEGARAKIKISKSVLIGVICSAIVILGVGLFFTFRTSRYTKGLKFEKYQGEYMVTSIGKAEGKEIVLPKWYRGRKVVAIGERAFADSEITGVTIPETVTLIKKEAFAGCEELNNIVYAGKKRDVIFNDGFACKGVLFGEDAFAGSCESYLTFDIAKSTDGDTVTTATITNIPQGVTKIKIVAGLVSATDIVVENEIDTTGLSEVSVEIDFGTYGYFREVGIELYKGETKHRSIDAEGVVITSPHYNFAYLNGTYPVLVYSLKLHEIAADYPTFTFLERAKAYDWDKLPYNVKRLPFLTKAASETEFDFHKYRQDTSRYIKTLYELDNNATFTFYGVDNYPELMLEFFVANKIPETNWRAYMLSDGTGTAVFLKKAFAVDNPGAKYDKMKKNWAEIKDYVYKNGFDARKIYKMVDYKWDSKDFHLLMYYTYVVAKEQENVEWWVNRLRTGENLADITEKDADFAQGIVNEPTSFYTNNLLSALSETQKAAFKQLYHFNEEMFAEAREQEKKIMVILGTSYSGEGESLYDYIRLTMNLYGDEYIYYYKGHPGFPTSLVPARQAQLDKLAKEGYTLYELDNSIAAEVIMYFNPDVYLSGWNSTTYESAENQEMVCAVYNFSKEDGAGFNYGDMIDIFITPKDDETYEGVNFTSGHRYYILNYNNTVGYTNQEQNYEKHEIAIYDATDNELIFYKWDASAEEYIVVAK